MAGSLESDPPLETVDTLPKLLHVFAGHVRGEIGQIGGCGNRSLRGPRRKGNGGYAIVWGGHSIYELAEFSCSGIGLRGCAKYTSVAKERFLDTPGC